jgi:Protein of unknown function (DUF642)/PEP-CTERM motif
MNWNVTAAAMGLALAAAAPASAAILVNGSFESPGGGPVRNALTTNYMPGWTYSNPTGSLDIYESDDQDGLTAADGTYYVSFGHNDTSGGSISQHFATVAGGLYTVNYSVAEQQGDSADQVMRATVVNGLQTLSTDNGALTLGFLPGTTLTFIATGSSATLTFFDATPPGGGAPSNLALDAVTVSGPQSGAVPEPASWALMLIGVGCLGAGLRTRRAVMLTA